MEWETSPHPSHPSHCLQGKLSCFFLRRGHTYTPTSGSWLSLLLEDNLFPSRQRPFVSPFPDHRERPLEAEGAGCTLGGGTVSGTAGKPGPGSRKGPPPLQVRKEAKPARHHQGPEECKHWPWPPPGPPDSGNSPGGRPQGLSFSEAEHGSRGYIRYWGEPRRPWRNERIRTPNRSKQKAGRQTRAGQRGGAPGSYSQPSAGPRGKFTSTQTCSSGGHGEAVGLSLSTPRGMHTGRAGVPRGWTLGTSSTASNQDSKGHSPHHTDPTGGT